MAKKVQQPPDPWQRTTTEHGFFADEVISALQKSIRRALLENAVLLGWEMYLTSEELEEKLWSRLCVIAVEDIGLGNPQAPVLVETLYQQHHRYPRPGGERFLFAAHAIRVLATSAKDRASDDLVSWAKHSVALGERLAGDPRRRARHAHQARPGDGARLPLLHGGSVAGRARTGEPRPDLAGLDHRRARQGEGRVGGRRGTHRGSSPPVARRDRNANQSPSFIRAISGLSALDIATQRARNRSVSSVAPRRRSPGPSSWSRHRHRP